METMAAFGLCSRLAFCEFGDHVLLVGFTDTVDNSNSDTFGHVPWMADYVRAVPGLGANMKEMRSFCIQRTQERIKLGNTSRKDLFYYLVRTSPLVRARSRF